jgi:branched-subunit amino acid transport protein
MATQTTWNNKAHGPTLAQSRPSSAKALSAPRILRDHLSFYLVFALFAAALCGLLAAAFGSSGVAWRGEFALWAAVPAGALTVLARFMTRKQLRG